MVALLRDRFYEGYRRHMKNGYYPIPDREVIEEACDEIVELELSKGDFKDPDSPDEQNEARIISLLLLPRML